MLCGKTRCPLLAKAQAMAKHSKIAQSNSVQGSTPPAIFVGRMGYPKVYIGPMIPPYFGNTEILDTPELWVGKSIEDIVDYRYALIRGKIQANIHDVSQGGKTLETMQELAMANSSIDSEAQFTKKPTGRLTFSENSQPLGPSAPLKNFFTSNIKVDRRIEKAYYDRDLKASDAIQNLYRDGVLVTRIQRSLSAGIFGLGARRKLVPTRWSITAIDSTLSLSLIEEIKQFNSIDEYFVFTFKNLGNTFISIFMPEKWSFESIEAWYPGTVWNIMGSDPAMMGDFEDYWGRSEYAKIGGCYYSARLAVAEKLERMRRQAAVIVLREIQPDYIMPVGVWNVRESMRRSLDTKPTRFSSLQEALHHAGIELNISLKRWIKNSALLQDALFQKKISDF